MDGLLFRTRVAVLWLAVGVAVSGSMLVGLFEPGAVEELLAGMVEGEPLDDATRLLITVLLIIPLVMAGVTLLVGDRVNLYVNLVAGLAFGLLGVGGAVMEFLGGHFNGHVVMVALSGVFAFLIAVLGVVELRQSSSTGADRPVS